jgi:hypothetical protein
MPELPVLNGLKQFVKSNKAIGACIECRFSTHEQSDLVCRRNPPVATILLVPGRVQGSAVPQIMTAFPVLKPDMWCGEFRRQESLVEPRLLPSGRDPAEKFSS